MAHKALALGISHDVVKLALVASVAPETGVVDADGLALASSGGATHLGSPLVHAHAHAAEAKKSNKDDTSNDGGDEGTGVGLTLLLGVVQKGSGELGGGFVVESGSFGLSLGLGSSLSSGGLGGVLSLLLVDLGDGDVDDLEVLTVLLGAVDTGNVHLTSWDGELTDEIVVDKLAGSAHSSRLGAVLDLS